MLRRIIRRGLLAQHKPISRLEMSCQSTNKRMSTRESVLNLTRIDIEHTREKTVNNIVANATTLAILLPPGGSRCCNNILQSRCSFGLEMSFVMSAPGFQL
jgi:hypothetical protein